MNLKNYLYFAKEAPDAGTDEEVIMVGADAFSHFEMKDTTKLHMWLKKGYGQEFFNAEADANILIGITITAGKHKEVMEHLASIVTANHLYGDGFIVVADSENSVFSHNDIKSCNVIEVTDASA